MTGDEMTQALAILGWSKGDFAKMLGCHRNTPATWSNGGAAIPASIVAWLKRRVHDFIQDAPPSNWQQTRLYRYEGAVAPPRSHAAKRPSGRRKPAGHDGSGKYAVFVYIAHSNGFVKVGISEDPGGRIASMRSANPHGLELLASVALDKRDAVLVERKTLEALEVDHTSADWFGCKRDRAISALLEVSRGYAPASKPVKATQEYANLRARPQKVAKPLNDKTVSTPDGAFISFAQAARHHGIDKTTAYRRAYNNLKGWSVVFRADNPEQPGGVQNAGVTGALLSWTHSTGEAADSTTWKDGGAL